MPEPAVTARRSWVTAVVQWRNWPVLVKIAAVLVVPVVGAMVLGILRVQADMNLADSYADVERLASLRGELVPTLSAIQRERALAMQMDAVTPGTFQQQGASVDVAVSGMDRLVRETPDLGPLATSGYEAMKRQLGGLPELRTQVLAGADSTAVLSGYNSITTAMLDFDRSLVGRFPDQELTGASLALFDLQNAREQVALQQALVLIGIRRGEMLPGERELLIEADVRLSDSVSDTRAVAPAGLWQQYVTTVVGPDVAKRQEFVRIARSGETVPPPRGRGRPTMPFGTGQWNATSDTTTGLMAFVARAAATELRAASTSLQNATSNRAGAESVLLLALVLLAAGIGGVVGRYLLRSLGTLRRTALDVAANRLPNAVASIRAGRPAAIEPVPVTTSEEFGQLARAFDTVHSQAVRSAEEEAALRGNLRNIFVNLSRRSQSLVERQLKLMEQLEQKENDPDQLASLFKLDHLATRMRRNNENLVVLSGAELGRRFTEHVPLADVLRAAVSEVEHYERAVVQSTPKVHVLGYAAGDLVRSIAELVENATAFSPPSTQVVIRAAKRENGAVLIEILDEGIGMADTELAAANAKVAASGGVDVPVSRQMGLFVVGSLANRHGVEVRLTRRTGEQGGLVASVLVPADLVPALDQPERPKQPAVAQPARHRQQAAAEIEPATVSGRLMSAGIFVRLPDLPLAKSPASILFQSGDDEHEPEHNGAAATLRVAPVARPAAKPPREPAAAPEPPPSADHDFTWLNGSKPNGPKPNGSKTSVAPTAPAPRAQPRAAAAPPSSVPQKPGELPKRVPQAQMFAEPRGNRPEPPASAPPARGGASGAERARGFLSSFQAGVRQSRTTGPAEKTGDDTGENMGEGKS